MTESSSLTASLIAGLRWSTRLGAKFFWAVPRATSVVLIATLVAQFSMLLAFFLPLKVIILLGSDGIPRYFPPAMAAVDRNDLIVWLSVASVGFYALYLLADRIVTSGADWGARQLLARSRKIVLFEGQDQIASDAYKRYAGVLAGGLFVFLAILFLSWLYPGVSVLLVGYIAVVGIFFLVGQAFSAMIRETLQERVGPVLAVLGAVGFMISFVYLVVDFLFGSPPGLIAAIIALLLARQAFVRLSALVPALTRLYCERTKLDALFFHRSAFVPDAQNSKNDLVRLFLPEQRIGWVPFVVEGLVGKSLPTGSTIRWHQMESSGVFAALCETPSGEGFLVKLFDPTCIGQAQHEATLLADAPAGLPAPEWVGATQTHGFQCHVLRLGPAFDLLAGDPAKAVAAVQGELLGLNPNKELVERYARSRMFLWQRLDDSWLDTLRIAAEGETGRVLQDLRGRMPVWRRYLEVNPLAFSNLDLKARAHLAVQDGRTLCMHWGRWTIEPAGAGWSTTPKMQEALKLAFTFAEDQRPELGVATLDRVVLASLSAGLEQEIRRGRFSEALKLLKPIQNCMNRLGGVEAPSGKRKNVD